MTSPVLILSREISAKKSYFLPFSLRLLDTHVGMSLFLPSAHFYKRLSTLHCIRHYPYSFSFDLLHWSLLTKGLGIPWFMFLSSISGLSVWAMTVSGIFTRTYTFDSVSRLHQACPRLISLTESRRWESTHARNAFPTDNFCCLVSHCVYYL